MKHAPFIAATGQTWKLVVLYMTLAVGILAAAGILYPPLARLLGPDEVSFGVFSGLVVGPALIAWIAWAICCPKCGTRLGAWYMKNVGVTEWFTSLVGSNRCPVCSFDGISSHTT